MWLCITMSNSAPVTPSPTPRPPNAWRSNSFRWLWGSTAVSTFGAEIGELALPLLAVITLTAEPGGVAALRSAQFLPFVLATLPFGLLVDRVRRRPLLIGADVGRFLVVALIPLAIWVGIASIPALCVMVFCAGTLTVLSQVAAFAFTPLVVSAEDLPDANARISATEAAAEIGGRGIAGVAVQVLGAPVTIMANAIGYLASAFALSRVRDEETRPARRPDSAQGGRVAVAEVKEGLRTALRNRYVRALLGEATTYNLFNEIFMIGFLLYAARTLRLSPAILGLVFVAGGVGSFLGAWFGTRWTGRWGYGRVLTVTLALGNTVPLVAVFGGAAGSWAAPLLGAVFLVVGLGIGVANSHAITVRQLATPDELRGRVNSAYRLISWGAIPVGAALGGAVAASLGAWSAVLVGGLGVAAATFWVVFSPVPGLNRVQDAAE
jgi:MFS family permease